ncbi:uncharacterized protein CLUP02_17090 [Colletotrichum lupini]|uniref:Uncharacterized protein n=1 Tax=Colletotrichum lupini TaxID=145971 RepID=A0A9Q8WQ55_9PEZI|nr:uncharacterized protein CLUP02_17090 [Colletotrichum lupini]UQC91554.1 hypothetical protein CLUP02_17090 [Colletotrichum lupini]
MLASPHSNTHTKAPSVPTLTVHTHKPNLMIHPTPLSPPPHAPPPPASTITIRPVYVHIDESPPPLPCRPHTVTPTNHPPFVARILQFLVPVTLSLHCVRNSSFPSFGLLGHSFLSRHSQSNPILVLTPRQIVSSLFQYDNIDAARRPVWLTSPKKPNSNGIARSSISATFGPPEQDHSTGIVELPPTGFLPFLSANRDSAIFHLVSPRNLSTSFATANTLGLVPTPRTVTRLISTHLSLPPAYCAGHHWNLCMTLDLEETEESDLHISSSPATFFLAETLEGRRIDAALGLQEPKKKVYMRPTSLIQVRFFLDISALARRPRTRPVFDVCCIFSQKPQQTLSSQAIPHLDFRRTLGQSSRANIARFKQTFALRPNFSIYHPNHH